MIIANWKCNGSKQMISTWFAEFTENYASKEGSYIGIAPPMIYLEYVKRIIAENSLEIKLGTQDLDGSNVARTGAISAEMILDCECNFSIVGHSERRTFHKETDLLIFQKVEMLLNYGITPIFCCGESLSDRESKNHFNVVKSQLSQILSNLSPEEFSKIVIAYEPVWAIGTGLTADPQDAQDMHSFIRGLISEVFGH